MNKLLDEVIVNLTVNEQSLEEHPVKKPLKRGVDSSGKYSVQRKFSAKEISSGEYSVKITCHCPNPDCANSLLEIYEEKSELMCRVGPKTSKQKRADLTAQNEELIQENKRLKLQEKEEAFQQQQETIENQEKLIKELEFDKLLFESLFPNQPSSWK